MNKTPTPVPAPAPTQARPIWYNKKTETPRRKSLGSAIRHRAPATLELKAGAYKRLREVFFLRTGNKVTHVDLVDACLIEGTETVYLIPTETETDATAPLLKNGGCSVNLTKLLVPAHLDLAPGRHQFYAATINEHSPVGIALEIDMSAPTMQKPESKRIYKKKRKPSPAPAPATPA